MNPQPDFFPWFYNPWKTLCLKSNIMIIYVPEVWRGEQKKSVKNGIQFFLTLQIPYPHSNAKKYPPHSLLYGFSCSSRASQPWWQIIWGLLIYKVIFFTDVSFTVGLKKLKTQGKCCSDNSIRPLKDHVIPEGRKANRITWKVNPNNFSKVASGCSTQDGPIT